MRSLKNCAFIIAFFFLLIPADIYGAGWICISGQTAVCLGDSISLSATVCNGVFFDDFDPGIDSALWNGIYGEASGDCGSASGLNALYFNDFMVREITTTQLMMNGGMLQYDIKVAATNMAGCEKAEIGEEVIVEYSVNNTTWITLSVKDVSLYPVFTQDVIPLPNHPLGKKGPTYIRWRQVNFDGAGFDNWAIDNVSITPTCRIQAAGVAYYWSPNIEISDTSSANPVLYPSTNRMYYLTIIDSMQNDTLVDSIYISIDTSGCLCSIPQNAVVSVSDTSAVISWDSLSGATEYIVTIDTGTVISDSSVSFSTSATSIYIDDLESSTAYIFTVLAICGKDTSLSTMLDIFYTTQTSINSPEYISAKIFPSPAYEKIYVHAYEAGFHCSIFDLQGKQIHYTFSGEKKHEIDISHFQSGVYIVRVEGRNRLDIKRFIKL